MSFQRIVESFAFTNREISMEEFQSIDQCHVLRPVDYLHFVVGEGGRSIPILLIEHPKPRNVIIYFHGNGESFHDNLLFYKYLSESWASTFICVEYPRYSVYQSKVAPTEAIVFSDAVSVYTYVLGKLNVLPNRVVVMGRSLGSGPATYLTYIARDVQALVLISPFSSVLEAWALLPKWAYSQSNFFKNYEYMPYINVPVLLLHGKKDRVVSFKNSIRLVQVVNNSDSKLIAIQNADHSNLFTESAFFEIIEENVKLFID